MKKTYEKWRPWLDAESKKAYDAKNISWDGVNRFFGMTGGILDQRGFVKNELKIMRGRVMDPVTGLAAVDLKMEEWYELLDMITELYIGKDGHLEARPDDPERRGMRRWLYLHQATHMLLFTILIMHESVYKAVVNFVYDCSGDKRYKRTQTADRADYLAERRFDMRPAADYFLRNGIAHSSFRINKDGSVLVVDIMEDPSVLSYDPNSESPPKGMKVYTYEQLRDRFLKSQSLLVEALAGVVYWFNVNHGTHRLFDDRFFGTPERDDVREAALGEMRRPVNIHDWKNILARFEKVLPP